MIVEDDPYQLMIYEQSLKEAGYKVVTASNGKDAVKKVEDIHNKIGLIFINCNVPILDGYQTAKKIKEFYSVDLKLLQIPIIAISGFSDENHKEFCKKAGFNEILIKPIYNYTLVSYAKYYLK